MSTTDRLHALDGLRGFALILGIFFHGGAGYIENFPPMLWPMREPSSTTLGVLFFVSHMFRMYMVGAWCWIFALIGLALRYLSDASPLRRYFADSSYWMYLMHLPVLAFFAAWWNPLPWHWAIKYPLQIAATLGVLLLSYRYLVRSTFIGAMLNGRRYPRDMGVANPRPHAAT